MQSLCHSVGFLFLAASLQFASPCIASFSWDVDSEWQTPRDSIWNTMSSDQLFTEGTMLMEEGFWNEAIRVWNYAIKLQRNNRNFAYKRAECWYKIGEDWAMVRDELLEAADGTLALYYDPYDAFNRKPPIQIWLLLAATEHRLTEFDKAKEHIDMYLDAVTEKHPYMELAAKLLDEIRFAKRSMERPEDVAVSRLSFNSTDQETNPMITADGKTLYFSSNRARSNGSNHGRLDPNTQQHYNDIYSVTLGEDSVWGEPQLLNVGVDHHAYVVNVDAFGTKMIVTDDDGWTSELKASDRGPRGWSSAEPFFLHKRIPNRGQIAFFPDGDRLVVSVKKRRGEGGFDLYESARNEDGEWSRPKSLGARVNTWGDEITPFVAADGQSIFFASNGLQGMGGFDVFKTTRNGAGGWSEPQHLGYPVNSVDDDLAFVVGAKGQLGYVSSRRDVTRGDLDVFEARFGLGGLLEEELIVLTLEASDLGGSLAPQTLVLRDTTTKEIVERIDLDPTQDVYRMLLPAGTTYELESEYAMATEEGTAKLSRTIHVPGDLKSEVIALDLLEIYPELGEEAGGTDEVYVVMRRVEEAIEVELEVEEEEITEVVEEEEVVDEPVEVLVEVPAEEPTVPAIAADISAPICDMSLSDVAGRQMLMAIQLFSGQVHTERMDLDPILDALATALKSGPRTIVIEGSASDGPSTRADGNEGLAQGRAMDVFLRLRSGLAERGFEHKQDYTMKLTKRVQPDGETPEAFRGGIHPAAFQYVRVDLVQQ